MENKKIIDKAIGFIQKNPKDNLSLQNIADSAGFSLSYFDAIFKRHTGYSPVEYSRIYKLTRSALDLRRTQKTVLEIALDFGYESPESFTRAFKSFYGISPIEYRGKYANEPVTWHDLSGKIAISHFRRSFPELKVSDIDLALDFCFTHNPTKYAEDITEMTLIETEILTLGDPDALEHFMYVSDYNSFEASVTLICENEEDALPYLELLGRLQEPRFFVRRSVDSSWEIFDTRIAKFGLTCRRGYDMTYSGNTVTVPSCDGMEIRPLTADDMTFIKAFKQNGGCAECHVRAIQIYFDGKGNAGMAPIGIFENGELTCLAMPELNQIRELKKYDIGALFTHNAKNEEKTVELMWKYVIDMSLKANALIGNANAKDDSTPLGISACEKLGFVKTSMFCSYRK